MDTEISAGLWSIGPCLPGACDACTRDRWRAIERDARFPALLAALVAAGFRVPPNRTDMLLRTVANYPRSANGGYDNYRAWNAVAQRLAAAAWNTAVAPFRERFPRANVSNYGFARCVPGAGTFDKNGHPNCAAVGGGGAVVGTLQARSHYFQMSAAGFAHLRPNGTRHDYAANCFNAARLEVNKARTSVAAAPHVPLAPWIAAKSWPGNPPGSNQCANQTLYGETVLHMLATGRVAFVLLWNPPPYGSAKNNDALAAALAEGAAALADLDAGAGAGHRNPIADTAAAGGLISWASQHLTSTVVLANHSLLSRFTPRLLPGESPADLLLGGGGGGGAADGLRYRLHCFNASNVAPVDLPLDRCTVAMVFPHGRQVRADAGAHWQAAGVWVLQPPGSAHPGEEPIAS